MVGGKQTENGYLGAFVTRVKKGSIADKVGRLEPGDEVIMWNDHELRGASSDRVCDIISASRDEKLVSYYFIALNLKFLCLLGICH